MLKLKHGQEITLKANNAKYYVVDVHENSISFISNSSMVGTPVLYTNEYFIQLFKYEEPFEPCEGDKVYSIDTSLMVVELETFSKSVKYDLERVFPTKEKAEEFLNKIKSIL